MCMDRTKESGLVPRPTLAAGCGLTVPPSITPTGTENPNRQPPSIMASSSMWKAPTRTFGTRRARKSSCRASADLQLRQLPSSPRQSPALPRRRTRCAPEKQRARAWMECSSAAPATTAPRQPAPRLSRTSAITLPTAPASPARISAPVPKDSSALGSATPCQAPTLDAAKPPGLSALSSTCRSAPPLTSPPAASFMAGLASSVRSRVCCTASLTMTPPTTRPSRSTSSPPCTTSPQSVRPEATSSRSTPSSATSPRPALRVSAWRLRCSLAWLSSSVRLFLTTSRDRGPSMLACWYGGRASTAGSRRRRVRSCRSWPPV
mmetsp:Transcript_16644/g.40045  ORF Transcript_16644/g.40045 Transcript_16644/m.40045 type:complete len:320 (-) Transcript_16644:733-1692(-)